MTRPTAPLGWGIVGASHIADRFVIPAIRADHRARLAGLASGHRDHAQGLAQRHAIPAVYDHVHQLVNDPAIDVVYVANHNHQHTDAVITAATAGKHVLCEKPLATTLPDADNMLTACHNAGVMLAVNHHLRQAQSVQLIRHLITTGHIGTLLTAHLANSKWLPANQRTWRVTNTHQHGGIALDLTVHDADLLTYLTNATITTVAATATNYGVAHHNTPDALHGWMRLTNNVTATFADTYSLPHAGSNLELHGTHATIHAHNLLTQRKPTHITLTTTNATKTIGLQQPDHPYNNTIAAITTAILTNTPPPADGTAGRTSLAVALAITRAAHEKRVLHLNPHGTVTPE